jgi:hypothetical protein
MKFDLPICGQTRDGRNVICEWDADAEVWVDTTGSRHQPEDLIEVEPDYETDKGYRPLPCMMLAITADGEHVRLTGWRPFVPEWETDTGAHFKVVSCPRPVVDRLRSLDAGWAS